MFMRKFCRLFRAGTITRSLTTGRTHVSTNNPHPSVLISAYQSIITDPSVIKNGHRTSILDLPIPLNPLIQDVPKIIIPLEDKINLNIIEDPTKVIEQQAARLITIRRKKMKKHKLKKLRKKMKHIWAKVRQRREMRKEKAFQAELMGQISEAEKFDAALYAKEKIDKANQFILPQLWKGRRYPDFIIRQLMDRKESKKKLREENYERRKNMNLKVSDYKL